MRSIEAHAKQPFFLYLPHTMLHVPLFIAVQFEGSSKSGLYADVVQEVDWSVGEVLKAIKRNGIDRETRVIFTSDNGPWLSYGDNAGTAGPLREGKGTSWEGGVRVPTIASLVGTGLLAHPIDGLDIWPLLRGDPSATSPHDAYYFYYNTNELQAMGGGTCKLILPHP